jgi:hypothetical protein
MLVDALKNTALAKKSKSKLQAWAPFALAGMIVVAIGTNRVSSSDGDNSSSSVNVTTPIQSAPDKHKASPLDISPLSVGMSLKAAASDPDALVIERALNDNTNLFVCVSYRGRNGFGGMTRGHAVFTVRGGDTSPRIWNKVCTSGNLVDVTSMVKTGATLTPQ